jgi:Flp pilus assembly protein TadD
MSRAEAQRARGSGSAGAGKRPKVTGENVDSAFAVHYNRALALERAGQAREAAAEFSEAARLDPSDVDAQVHLGLLLRELGRDEDANRAFLAALELQRRSEQLPRPRRGRSLPLDFGP